MNSFFSTRGLGHARLTAVLVAAFSVAAAADAATITWGTATNLTGASDVFTAGSLTYGYTESNQAATVNGVTFAAGNSTTSLGGGNVTMSGFDGGVDGGGYNAGRFSAPYGTLIQGGAFSNAAGTATVNLNNLSTGHLYAMQFWVADYRAFPGNYNRSETLTAGNTSGSLTYLQVTNGVANSTTGGTYVIGRFTADAASQAITITSNASSQMNAIQVRDITGAWNGAASTTLNSSDANFDGGSYTTISGLSTPVTALSFADTDGFGNSTAGKNSITVDAAGFSAGSLNFLNNAVNYTLQNASGSTGITGTTALTKSGTGTLVLSSANTYSGATTISGGVLQVGTGGTDGSLGSGGVTNNASLVFNRSDDLTVANAISGSGLLSKSGPGKLTLTGSNSYSGGTAINAGTLSVSAIAGSGASNIGNSGALTFGGGTLQFTGASGAASRPITFNSGSNTIEVAAGSSLTLGSAAANTATWTGGGGVTKTGAGTLVVQNNGDGFAGSRFVIGTNYGGNFTMQSGTLTISPDAFMTIGDSNQTSGTATYSQTGGSATFTATGGLYIGNWGGGSGNTANLSISGGTFTQNSGVTYVGRGNGGASATVGNLTIGGGAGASLFAAPTVSIAAANNTGNVTISANGTLVTSSIVDGGGTSNLVFDGGTLQVSSSFGSGTLMSGLDSAQIKNAGAIIDTNGKNATISQAFANAASNVGGLTKTGAGTLTLSGENSYSGGTAINAGTLKLDFGSRSGNPSLGSFAVASGATLNLDNTNPTLGSYEPSGVVLSGSGSITKTGTGSIGLWTSSSLTGFTGTMDVQQGSLGVNNIGGNAAMGQATLNIAAGAKFDVRFNATLVVDKLTGSGTLDQSYAFPSLPTSVTVGSSNGSSTFAGVIQNSSGVGMPVTKTGTGTFTLTGANTYTGATTVSAGKLSVNGSLGNTAVSVASGATLGGSGSIAGPVTVNGFLSPGNSPGVITLGSLVLGGTSTTLIEITGTSRGSAYDGVDITTSSGLTYGGILSLDFSLLPTAVADNTTFDIFGFLGSPSGNFSSVTSTGLYSGTWTGIGGGNFELVSGGQTLTFSQATGDIIVVPEPGTLALAAGGIAAGVAAYRRRRSNAGSPIA